MKILLAASFLFVFVLPSQAQVSVLSSENEQSRFTVEEIPGESRVRHPIPVPDGALEKLQTDGTVKSCLKDNPLEPGKSLSSWFVASLIHLNGPKEADLVVVPSFQGQESMCFQSPAGIGLFWIFRKHGERYELVLSTWGGGLEILTTKTNSYRNVMTGTLGQAGRNLTNITFHFTGTRYVANKETTQEQR